MTMPFRSRGRLTFSALLTFALAACGGGGGGADAGAGGGSSPPPMYTIGGTAHGLAAGQQIVVANNGAELKTLSADGSYTFTGGVPANGSYAVTVATQPAGEICTVSNNAGAGVTGNVAGVDIVCSAITHAVGGTVAGLAAGQQVTLDNNGDDPLAISADGTFAFATPVAFNGSYAVTVGVQPTGQTCTVSAGSGAGVTGDVSSVAVTCSANTFQVGGAVTGLTAGQQVTLTNNSADPVTVDADGAFTFANPVSFNGGYDVIIGTQPTGQTCTVSNGSGAGVVASIANVSVTCSTNTYTIGGTVTGLTAGQQVTLKDNGADPKIITAAGAFTFSQPVAFNGSYTVTIGTQPTGQTCTVSNGSGAGVTANVGNVAVTCSTNAYTIGGTVSGLAAGQQITLQDNGADSKTIAANGAFTFTTPVAFNGSYAVTIGTQPAGQTCTVSNGSGAGVVANIANVSVTCSANTYAIGGAVSGLGAGEQVTLNNNGADPLTMSADGAFTFTMPVAYHGSYAVTVGTQPTGKTCTVSSGSGTNVAANVGNVGVTCSTSTYTIGGTVTGLASGQQVTLNNNAGNPLTVTADGAFTFTTPVSYNGSYAVTVGTQPTAQTCRVTSGSGSGVTASVASVAISCRLALAYVTNATDNTISTYTIGQDGALTPLGAPVATGLTPNTVAVDPNGRYAYVTNLGSDTVWQYAIAADGALTFASSVATESLPYSVAIDPTGRYAYVTNQASNSVSQYTIGAGGALSLIGTASVPSHPYQVTIDPTGCYVYVANLGTDTTRGNTVSQFSIGAGGALVPMAVPVVTTDSGPIGVTVDPSGTHAYVAHFFGMSVLQYDIDNTGALVPSGAPAITTVDGNYPMVITPDGKYAYWSIKYASEIAQCALVAGALDCSAGSIPANGSQPQYMAIDPFSRHAYAVNYSAGGAGSVSQYDIGATGLLTLIGGAAPMTGAGPFSIVTTR